MSELYEIGATLTISDTPTRLFYILFAIDHLHLGTNLHNRSFQFVLLMLISCNIFLSFDLRLRFLYMLYILPSSRYHNFFYASAAAK